jgi:hypothetical protein
MTAPLLYTRLLALYPEPLRREFGAEMALVFAEDLESARRDQGLCGVVRVWRCALGEFVRFALPGHLSSPVVRVPAIASGVFICAMTGQIAFFWRHAPSVPAFFQVLAVALFLPMFVTPAVSLLAVWACHERETLSLHLSEERPSCSKSAI